jgi:hypothetical protein
MKAYITYVVRFIFCKLASKNEPPLTYGVCSVTDFIVVFFLVR